MRAMYANGECDVCERQVIKTAGAMYANNRCDVCERQEPQRRQQSGQQQTAAFINHKATVTSVEPTHVPVHDRIRNSL